MFTSVAVPVPLGTAFTYSVPESLASLAVPGVRVLCEFGRRKVLGVVLETMPEAPPGLDPARVKPLLAVLDRDPALPPELLRFLVELANYYLAPIGEVLRLALPQLERERLAEASDQQLFEGAAIGVVGRMVQVAESVVSEAPHPEEGKLRGNARAILELLRAEGPQAVSELGARFSTARSAVRRLSELGLVRVEQRPRAVDPYWGEAVERDQAKPLNPAQLDAVRAIISALEAQGARAFLLDGVTGSGKTEVYLQIVEACRQRDGGVVVLVPEIALTPQLVARFRARFGDSIAVLHSGLSDVERTRMWRSLRDGVVRIAIGARSALFAPVRDLRLIVVDEEHDASFKQEEGVRYHARDMALLRAHRAGALCVLGSATPSLASEALVQKGSVTRLRLPDRAVIGASLPEVEVINLRNFGPGPSGNRLLSLPLHREIQRVLEAKKQAILFLNRRGFAPSLICESCGTVVECPNCSVSLTLHRAHGERLRCHYCDYTTALPKQCERCGGTRLSQEGVGTERVEHALAESFPGARVARLDRDVAAGLKSERILDRMRAGEVDILVGTQMVTKGHDLPNVALVGVLNADAALSLPDFQASERTFSLLVQVAGRAGRGEVRGKVLIQTRNPEHPAIRYAQHHDTRAFVERELGERKEGHYPPYYRLLMVRVDSVQAPLAERVAAALGDIGRRVCRDRADVLGPSPAPLERLKNRYRYRLLIRAVKRAPLYAAAHAILNHPVDRRVRVSLDIDPVSML